MTYPQNGAPSQQAPQYGFGQPQQQPPMQFMPPSSAGAPAPGPAPAAPLSFQDPSRGGGVTPAARNLDGCTVIFVPKRIDESTTYGGQPRPTAFFDLYVVDSPTGTVAFGDCEDQDPSKRRPATHTVAAPAFFPNVMMGSTAIVNEIRSKLRPDGTPTGLSVGVVQRSPRGRFPWLLTPCDKDANGNARPDGEQRRASAQALYHAHQSGQWQPPAAVPIAQMAAPAGQGVVSYAQPAQQPNPYTGPVMQATPGPQGPVYQQQAAAPQQATQQVAQQGGMWPPAPGWPAESWAQFTPEQQAQLWAQVSGTPAPPAPAPASPAPPQGQPNVQAAGPGW